MGIPLKLRQVLLFCSPSYIAFLSIGFFISCLCICISRASKIFFSKCLFSKEILSLCTTDITLVYIMCRFFGVVLQILAKVSTLAREKNDYGAFQECAPDKAYKKIFSRRLSDNKNSVCHEDSPLENSFRYESSSAPQSLGSSASLSPSPTRL